MREDTRVGQGRRTAESRTLSRQSWGGIHTALFGARHPEIKPQGHLADGGRRGRRASRRFRDTCSRLMAARMRGRREVISTYSGFGVLRRRGPIEARPRLPGRYSCGKSRRSSFFRDGALDERRGTSARVRLGLRERNPPLPGRQGAHPLHPVVILVAVPWWNVREDLFRDDCWYASAGRTSCGR